MDEITFTSDYYPVGISYPIDTCFRILNVSRERDGRCKKFNSLSQVNSYKDMINDHQKYLCEKYQDSNEEFFLNIDTIFEIKLLKEKYGIDYKTIIEFSLLAIDDDIDHHRRNKINSQPEEESLSEFEGFLETL